jgi:dihydrolipoamide dehydrogenase-binding protein of pyruvate dehydrogenase complex
LYYQKPENSTEVKIGTLIAIMVEEGDDWQNVEIPAETEPPAEQTAQTSAASSPSPSTAPSQTTQSPVAVPQDLHAHG